MKKYLKTFLFSLKAKRKVCKRKKNFSDRESSRSDDWNYKKISQAFLTENFTPVASSGHKIFLNACQRIITGLLTGFYDQSANTVINFINDRSVTKPIKFSLKFFSPTTEMKPREFHFNIEKRLSKAVKFLYQSPSPRDVNLHTFNRTFKAI